MDKFDLLGNPLRPPTLEKEIQDLRAENARLREALERIADFNCEREGWRNCKCPCGECESCIARAALEVKP